MKKRTILAFGLLAGILLLAGGSFQGEAMDLTVILENRGHCPVDEPGPICWIDPKYEEADCNECCNMSEYIVDRYGCECCCPPGGGGP